ncbi:hypothetical protein PAMA_020643 [Pampus argenteus]
MSAAKVKYTWSHAVSLQCSFDLLVYNGKDVAVKPAYNDRTIKLRCDETSFVLSCSAGRYGESCRLTCDCGGASCDPITGRCICPAGKTGDTCQEVCESGYWGQSCISKCQCQERSLSCDPVTGQCVCEAGFTGDYCERKCVDGTYGQGCVQQCQCQSGALCDHVSGACTCSPGYAGTFCEKTASSNQSDVLSWPTVCPDGFYGLDCGQMCECRNGARCHHITGACLCTAGWAGPHCILGNNARRVILGSSAVRPVSVRTEPGVTTSPANAAVRPAGLETAANCCEKGRYGENCTQICGCANRGRCDRVTGRCVCQLGWMGELCQSACPAGMFGQNCSQLCQCSGDQEHCNPVTGKCSCLPGYYGARCELRCRTGTFGPNCKSRCSCLNGGRCDFRTGACYCPPGFIGADCSSSCPSGYYGKDCAKLCSCEGGQCHSVNGWCICAAGRMGQSCQQGGAMAYSAETHATVRTEVCVTLSTGPASVDWAGLDPAVTQTVMETTLAQTALCRVSVPTAPTVMDGLGDVCAHSPGWAPPVVKPCYTKPQEC